MWVQFWTVNLQCSLFKSWDPTCEEAMPSLAIKEHFHTLELPRKIFPRTVTINPTLPNLHGITPADREPTETIVARVFPKGHPGTTLTLSCKLYGVIGTRTTVVPASVRAVEGQGGTGKVRSHLVKSFDSSYCRQPQRCVNCHLQSWSIRRAERPTTSSPSSVRGTTWSASCLQSSGSSGMGQEHPALNWRLSYLVIWMRITTWMGKLDSPRPTCNTWVSLACTTWFAYQDSRKRSPLAPAAVWVARESSCGVRRGDAQVAHSRKTGDETGRAIRLPGHEALEWSSCCPCAVTGSTTRPGGPSSNTDDVQEVQTSKLEEKSKMAHGVTRGFKLLFSWTLAISLYREQGVMDMAFMSELLLAFFPSPPSFNCNRRKSLPLLFKYSHYGFGSSCLSKKCPVVSSWEE